MAETPTLSAADEPVYFLRPDEDTKLTPYARQMLAEPPDPSSFERAMLALRRSRVS